MAETKKCTRCKETKLLVEFYKDSRQKDGLGGWCKSCRQRSNNVWREANKARVVFPESKLCCSCKEIKAAKAFHKNRAGKDGLVDRCKECTKNHDLQRRYGITTVDLEEYRFDQQNVCAICQNPKKLNVDHDHLTGDVRGLLCHSCNTGLGHFFDDPNLLRLAIKYLEVADHYHQACAAPLNRWKETWNNHIRPIQEFYHDDD